MDAAAMMMPYAGGLASRKPDRLLFWYAAAWSASTLFLLMAGGLVTSHGAGLAVPDWPLTYGRNPLTYPLSEWHGNIFYEHGHRLVATGVGLLTIGMAVLLAVREPRRWVRRLGWAALAAVIVQGLLGGLTVKYFLPAPISVGHAGLAQLFFCTTVLMALFQSRTWLAPRPMQAWEAAARLRRTCVAVAGLIYAQVLLGAVVRHTESGLAIPGFPLSYGRVVPPLDAASLERINEERRWAATTLPPVTAGQIAVQFSHRVGALVVAGAVFLTLSGMLRRCGSRAWLTRPACLMGALVMIQAGLGAATVWTERSVWVNTAHVLGGALLLATSVLLAAQMIRVVGSGSAADGAEAGIALEARA